MYDIFMQLCSKKGISTYKFCKDTGVSQGTISNWKTRGSVGKDTLFKIADYFGVSIEYVMGKETSIVKKGGEKYYLNEETAQIAQTIFENKEMRVLFDACQDAQPEDLKTVYDMLLALKRKEKGE